MNRRLFISFFIIASLQTVLSQELKWNPTNGPYGGMVSAAVVDRQGILYIGAGSKGVYKSVDGGNSWNWCGLPHIAVTTMAVDSSGNILAASRDSLFVSSNFGESWGKIPLRAGSFVMCLVVAPDGRIVVGTKTETSWSTNQGGTWTTCGATNATLSSLTFTSSDTWLAGSSKGIRKSTDQGNTWSTTDSAIWAVSFYRNSAGVLYAGASDWKGVYRSTDDGLSWRHAGLDGGWTIVAFAEPSPGLMLAASYPLDPSFPGGVYRCSDGDTVWTPTGLQNTTVYSLLHLLDRTIIAATYLGMHRSTDNGATWEVVNNGLTNTTISGIFVAAPSTILAATDVGIFQSVDGGGSWKNCYPDLNPPWVVSVAADANQRLFFGTMLFSPLGGIYRSVDSGATWVQVSGSYITGMYEGITGLVVAPNGHVFAGFGNLTIFRSTDQGDTWERVNRTVNGGAMKALAADSAGRIYAALWGKGLLRSTDDGTTWAKADSGISNKNLSSITVKGTTWIFTGGAAGYVFRSSDHGASWDSVRTGLPRNELKSLAVASNGDIVASLFGAGVYRSTNDGMSWAPSGDGLPGADVNVLAASSDGTIYAGTSTFGMFSSKGSLVGVPPRPDPTPRGYSLQQNYPNPFNPTTVVSYQLSVVSQVKLIVFDLLGRQVATLVNEKKSPGLYDVSFDGSGLASGIYFYRLQVRPLDAAVGRDSKGGAGEFMQTRKMILVK